MDNNRESQFSRTQPGRSSVRSQVGRKASATTDAGTANGQRQQTTPAPNPRQTKETSSPRSTGRLVAPHSPLDSLKQWELVEGDRGLTVVEKKSSQSPRGPPRCSDGAASPRASLGASPAVPPRTMRQISLKDQLNAFKDSKIVQPIAVSNYDADVVPISLDLILNQQEQQQQHHHHQHQQQQQQQKDNSAVEESTDMLQKLELQVKAIEMGTLAARKRPLQASSDFEPEIQLRYREHEDLLRNVTDDEAEG